MKFCEIFYENHFQAYLSKLKAIILARLICDLFLVLQKIAY